VVLGLTIKRIHSEQEAWSVKKVNYLNQRVICYFSIITAIIFSSLCSQEHIWLEHLKTRLLSNNPEPPRIGAIQIYLQKGKNGERRNRTKHRETSQL